jgi:hypothetical protein
MFRTRLTRCLLAVTMTATSFGLPGCGSSSNDSPDAEAHDAAGGLDSGGALDGTKADADAASDDVSAPDGSDAAGHDAAAADGAATDAAATDAAADVESPDAALCNTCTGGRVCVSDQVVGGAVIVPDDAGMCPAGRIPTTRGALTTCVQEPAYHCELLPGACSAGGLALSPCSCDPTICPPAFTCSLPSPTLVQCVEAVP